MNEKIAKIKLVPVVKLDNAADAIPLAHALIAGNLPIAEVTFRTDAAYEAIKAMSTVENMIVGAGTVINIEQAKKAKEAGAKFIVSPGFNKTVVEFALSNDIAIYPGACTPTEIMYSLEYNLEVIKFFPAESYGGLSTISALLGPFSNIKVMPTGGIGPNNIKEYLANPKIIACGGSWMVKDTLIKSGQFSNITTLTQQAVALINS